MKPGVQKESTGNTTIGDEASFKKKVVDTGSCGQAAARSAQKGRQPLGEKKAG